MSRKLTLVDGKEIKVSYLGSKYIVKIGRYSDNSKILLRVRNEKDQNIMYEDAFTHDAFLKMNSYFQICEGIPDIFRDLLKAFSQVYIKDITDKVTLAFEMPDMDSGGRNEVHIKIKKKEPKLNAANTNQQGMNNAVNRTNVAAVDPKITNEVNNLKSKIQKLEEELKDLKSKGGAGQIIKTGGKIDNEKLAEMDKEFKKIKSENKKLVDENKALKNQTDKNSADINDLLSKVQAISVKKKKKKKKKKGGEVVEGEDPNLAEFNEKYHKNYQKEDSKVHVGACYIGTSGLDLLCTVMFLNLKQLYLNDNKISKIQSLATANFLSLLELNLDNNTITDISCLLNCQFPELTILSLANNQIEDISIMENAPFNSLIELSFSSNKISDISVFDKIELPFLKKLYLSSNQITDITCFSDDRYNTLDVIFLHNNPIDQNERNNKLIIEKLSEKVDSFNI